MVRRKEYERAKDRSKRKKHKLILARREGDEQYCLKGAIEPLRVGKTVGRTRRVL